MLVMTSVRPVRFTKLLIRGHVYDARELSRLLSIAQRSYVSTLVGAA